MQGIRQVWPSDAGLVYEVAHAADDPDGAVIDMDIDGRRIWSFRQQEAAVPPELLPEQLRGDREAQQALRFQAWPPALVPRLRGQFRVRLRPAGLEDGAAEAVVVLGGSTDSVRLVDHFGRSLVVNKWGRLGHAIADADPGMVDRMLDHVDDIRTVLEKRLGPVVYVTGGTLLGPVREGRILPHDDDADLGYVSGHTHPADVAIESFEIGRLLREAGYDVLRLSVGHLQILFSHEGVPDHYVDVFAGFVMDGVWYQHFPIRTEATRDDLLPTSTVMVEGRPEPAPRTPEIALEANYGPGWRTPDPAFSFELPASTGDRFYGWWADYNVEREDWEDVILLAPPGTAGANDRISAFVRRVHEHTPVSCGVLDLGCGVGTDALALAALGRSVRALDFSRHAIDVARSRAGDPGLDVTFDILNLLDTREVIRLGTELAGSPRRWAVLGRRLLNALEDRGRDNVFRLCSMLMRHGEAAYFDVVADHDYPGIVSYRHLSVDQVVEEAAKHRLVLEEAAPRLEPFRWFGSVDEQVVETYHMTFRRRTR